FDARKTRQAGSLAYISGLVFSFADVRTAQLKKEIQGRGRVLGLQVSSTKLPPQVQVANRHRPQQPPGHVGSHGALRQDCRAESQLDHLKDGFGPLQFHYYFGLEVGLLKEEIDEPSSVAAFLAENQRSAGKLGGRDLSSPAEFVLPVYYSYKLVASQ